MTTYCDGSLVKWFTFAFVIGQVLSAPKTPVDENEIKEIFSESKRDVAAVPLLKSPIFNPYLMYPPIIPGKPIFYPPLLPITPSDVLLSRLGKSVPSTPATGKPPLDTSDPSLMSAYFKAKKDEFLTKLFEKISNTSTPLSKRAAADDAVEPTKPILDSSFFLKKKYEFLETLFKSLNVTPTPAVNITDVETVNSTSAPTPKPTIVSPDFWFPFAKLPKPTKAPKPTKPPKAKKILKDALDTILLQSLLIDMGVDPKDASLNKRAATLASLPKKSKTKKIKPGKEEKEEEEEDKGEDEVFIPPKIDPTLFSSKASDCLNKLFKILNKTDSENLDTFVKPKTTAVPATMWKQPSETEYASKLDAFLDLLIKSLNATEYLTEKSEKSGKPLKSFKSKGKKVKRSTFLDELLHRATTPLPTTTTPEPTIAPEDIIIHDTECDIVQFLKECCGCGDKCVSEAKSGKSLRSLIFKPFGSGYWIPQYLYAAKMGMYLDKLMDSINTAAANEVESESSDMLKRSVDSADVGSNLPSREAALSMIIAELTDLKNDIVDAFSEGIEAQKNATSSSKPFKPAAKSFKKPFWGPKAFPTTDPVAPIQKRIDILNDVFDKLTKVEKTLIFTAEPEYDPKLLANLTEILEMNFKSSKPVPTAPTEDPESPEYFLSKTKEYLKTLYGKSQDE